MWRRLPGSAQRYVNTETGESISRRQYEKLVRPEAVEAREERYRERKAQRRFFDSIPREQIREENRRYWRQRVSEQWAIIHDFDSDSDAREDPAFNEFFDALWEDAEDSDFEGGEGSAWDDLAYMGGAKGGADDESERSRYLAIIGWYTSHGQVYQQQWMERAESGRFVYPGLPREILRRHPHTRKRRRRNRRTD